MKQHAICKISFFLLFVLVLGGPASIQAQDVVAPPTIALSLDASPIEITVDAISRAERSIVAVVYKFEDPRILRALDEAEQRGVAVQLVVDAEEADVKKSLVDDAQKLGMEARYWSDGKLHAKFAVVDGELVLSGSFNWTKSARKKNVELILAVSDPEVVDRFTVLFSTLWEGAGR